MMKRILAIIALLAGSASPALAQVTQAKYDSLAARVTVLEQLLASIQPTAPPPIAYSVETSGGAAPGITVQEDGGNFTLRSNVQNNVTQSGITDSYCAMIGVNGWDGGYRVLQNWNHCGTKRLPYSTIGMDSQGDFSYNWFPPENDVWGSHPDAAPASVHGDPSHPLYAAYRGQALVISGRQVGYGYMTGQPLWQTRNVMIAAQRAGQSLYFAVSPHRSAEGTALNRVIMQLEANPDFPQNPFHVVIDGELRRLKSCQIGGQNVVCF